MKILFTGGSSFTGMWFVKELADGDHDITTIFRKKPSAYTGTRKERVSQSAAVSSSVFGCGFGDETFLKIIGEGSFDVLCHHGAEVSYYKRQDFDPVAALANNTRNISEVLKRLRNSGCRKIVATGTVFESYEGAGSDRGIAFSPYGLSKTLTSEMFSHYACHFQMRLGKFVIPNPFGPYEEGHFTSYLAKEWLNNNVAVVDYPAYVRDNIHVSLLAKAYRHFVERLSSKTGIEKLCPSGYPESQGTFTKRFAAELSSRWGASCAIDIRKQELFLEPRVRINTDVLDPAALNWDEDQAWDEAAEYYKSIFKPQR